MKLRHALFAPALVLFVAAAVLIGLWQHSSRPDYIAEAKNRALALGNYAVRIDATVWYSDGSEKRVWGQDLYELREEPYDLSAGETGVDRIVARRSDPMMVDLPTGPPRIMLPNLVLNRQPGRWTLLAWALEYLASAPHLTNLGEETMDGVTVVRYGASFRHRPDLELYRRIKVEGPNAEELQQLYEQRAVLREMYENAPQTVDVWIGKDDFLVHRIEIVTTGLNYPESMPEPNDLRGAVEERVSLVFADFNSLHPSRFISPRER